MTVSQPKAQPCRSQDRDISSVTGSTTARTRGRLIHSGEAGFRLKRDPETLRRHRRRLRLGGSGRASIDEGGILRRPARPGRRDPLPSDRRGRGEKVEPYLEVGTVVWVVDPDFRTVTVHRPGHVPETFNETQELSGEPELPGFRVPVAELFS